MNDLWDYYFKAIQTDTNNVIALVIKENLRKYKEEVIKVHMKFLNGRLTKDETRFVMEELIEKRMKKIAKEINNFI